MVGIRSVLMCDGMYLYINAAKLDELCAFVRCDFPPSSNSNCFTRNGSRLMMNRILSENLSCRFGKIRCVFYSDGSDGGNGGGGCGPSIDGRTVETAISPTQGCFL